MKSLEQIVGDLMQDITKKRSNGAYREVAEPRAANMGDDGKAPNVIDFGDHPKKWRSR